MIKCLGREVEQGWGIRIEGQIAILNELGLERLIKTVTSMQRLEEGQGIALGSGKSISGRDNSWCCS